MVQSLPPSLSLPLFHSLSLSLPFFLSLPPSLPPSLPLSPIFQDLHRTGTTGFTTEEEHAILKTVLLAYARHNQAIGYCQGFNILAALILKVVDFDERMALTVCCLLDLALCM